MRVKTRQTGIQKGDSDKTLQNMGRVNGTPLSFLCSCWLIPSSRIRELRKEASLPD